MKASVWELQSSNSAHAGVRSVDWKPVKPAESKQNHNCVTCFMLQAGNQLIPLSLSLRLPLPPHPHLRPPLPLLFHPFILLRPLGVPPPRARSEWFLLSSSAETMFETWYCLSGSIRLAAVRGPSARHQAPTLAVSCQTLTPPFWESSPPLLFVSTFPSIFYSPSFCLPLPTSHSELSLLVCSPPSLHC